jgi:putative iron-dependent peroxidase
MTPEETGATGTGQAGILSLGTTAHAYLEFLLEPDLDVEPSELVRLIADLREPRRTIGGVNLVVGFRPSLWRRLEPGTLPDEVTDFDEAVTGQDGFTLPATQRDLLLWISGASYDVVYDMARAALAALRGTFRLREEIASWSYQHDRDLTGFIDGSANPTLLEAPQVAWVSPGDAGAGGSVCLLQRWVHDTDAWEALPVSKQEAVIGRTKADSIELKGDARPVDSHVARTELVVGGQEFKVFRRNTPFGTVSEHGTVFLGFSRERWRLHEMLRRMAGTDGVRDALTRYTHATSGSYYWVPPVEHLLRHMTPVDD